MADSRRNSGDAQRNSAVLSRPSRVGSLTPPALPGELDVVRARIPGRVIRIQARPGDVVAGGQALMVLEAMKMEDDIRAPRDAVIDRIPVSEGDRVSRGAELVTFLPGPVDPSGGSNG